MNSALEVPETNPVAKQVYLKAFGARVPNPYSKEGIMKIVTRHLAAGVYSNMKMDFKKLDIPLTRSNAVDYLTVLQDGLRRQPQNWLVRRTIDATYFLIDEMRNT